MFRRFFYSVVFFATVSLARSQESSAYPKPDPGAFKVRQLTFEWKDEKRSRVVPVKIYLPEPGAKAPTSDKPFPVVLFSHGLGGSRENYGYLGQFWASHGYVSVHLQHEGADTATFKGAGSKADILSSLKKAVANPKNALDRPKDVSFILDQLAKENTEHETLKNKLNLDAVGLAGHSFGAHTTLMSAGQSIGGILGKNIRFKDERIKAIIPMSAPAPKGKNLEAIYAEVKIPTMHMTGTRDESPINDTKASERRIPFDNIKGVDQWFLNFQDGDHMIFSGRLSRPGSDAKKSDAEFQRAIKQASLAFWDAHLRNDDAAKTWLQGESLEKFLGPLAQLERKRK